MHSGLCQLSDVLKRNGNFLLLGIVFLRWKNDILLSGFTLKSFLFPIKLGGLRNLSYFCTKLGKCSLFTVIQGK